VIEVLGERVTGPGAWVGAELQHESTWIHHLDPKDIAEIEAALTCVEKKGLSIPFEAADFPLPGLSSFLETIPGILENGPGFMLVRGLPRERYTPEDCELICWGLGVQLGTPISQNTRGHLLGHVRDEGKSLDDPNVRGYQTAAKMDFHADQLPVDILGLFCVTAARSGGASALVSAVSVHNVLLDERPDLLEVLYEPFCLDWRGEEPPGSDPWYRSPMFSHYEGKITSRFTSRQYFASVSRYDESLAPTDLQWEALDYVQDVANRPELRLSMIMREGDLQLLNNHVILHARDAFEDYEDPDRKRHLLRMWVATPAEKRRPLSPLLAERYRIVESGGIPVKARP